MAGLEADTSSYRLPTTSPMDAAKNIAATRSAVQQNISNEISIDKQKLELINTQFGLMQNELANIADKNLSKPQAAEIMNRFATTYKLPPAVTKHMMDELNAAPDAKSWAMMAQRRGMEINQKMNEQFGAVADKSDSQFNYQGVQQPASKGGGFTPGTRSAVQLPPNQTIQDDRGKPGFVGAGAAPGFGAANPLPVASAPPVPSPRARPALPAERPVAPPAPVVSGPTGKTVNRGTEFENRFGAAFPNAVAAGPAPGTAEATRNVGEQSGKDYATDLRRLNTYQADLQPDLAVLDIVKDKGPGDFGPGTDTLNQLKRAAVTWLPNVDAKLIESAKDYDTVKKYLVQGARTSGNTGTNDQLAAAFDANPNVTMNTATIESIVKTRVALKKLQAAQTLLFGQQNLPDNEYSKWISKNQNVLDPRAFGFDMMNNEAKAKLLGAMAEKDRNGHWIAKKGKEKEFKRFENSLGFANDAGLIEPPGRS